jgi:hypothetical protein
MNTFIHLEWNYKNPDADSNDMTTFGERVKNVWKNIYPLWEPKSEKKEKKK